MKKIVISGYYGFNNLGDEAILAGIISLLKDRSDKLQITVLSASPQETAERYQLQSVSRNSLFQILSVLSEADLFISGGGSLLQDVTGNFTVPYYLGLAWLAKLQGTKAVCYAQGVGPLKQKWSQFLTAITLNRFELLGVRDYTSKKLLKKIGVKNEIQLSVDPVFALYEPLNNKKQKIKGKIEVGISVRPWSVDYISQLAAALNKFAESKNLKYILFPMHQGTDEKVSKLLRDKLEVEAEICNLPSVPTEALKEFNQLDLFVGVRLHSLIFALLNQIPLLALSYDPKIEALMEELDYLPLIKLQDLDAERAVSELETIFSKRYSLRKKIAGFLKSKKDEAEIFADKVLEVVESCAD